MKYNIKKLRQIKLLTFNFVRKNNLSVKKNLKTFRKSARKFLNKPE